MMNAECRMKTNAIGHLGFLQFIVRGGRPSIITFDRIGFFDLARCPAAEPLGSVLARDRENLLAIQANGVSTITITHSAALLRWRRGITPPPRRRICV
jgi:hypothetical protein